MSARPPSVANYTASHHGSRRDAVRALAAAVRGLSVDQSVAWPASKAGNRRLPTPRPKKIRPQRSAYVVLMVRDDGAVC